MKHFLWTVGILTAAAWAQPHDPVAVLSGIPPYTASEDAMLAAALLEAEGFTVALVSAAEVCDAAVLTPENAALYVVPDAAVYPAAGLPALESYLAAGGKVMLLGGPAFTRLLWRRGDAWFDRDALDALRAQTATAAVLFDFENDDEGPWHRATDDVSIRSEFKVVASDRGEGGRCGAVRMERMGGWLTYASPVVERMFPEDHTLLCLWAKGTPATTHLSLEINEHDGSRWMAVITLESAWKRYVLAPSDFVHWPDGAPAGRGRPGDRMRPEAACRLVVGLSRSHTPQVGGGPHTFWIDAIGTAPDPCEDLAGTPEHPAPIIESVSPAYKTYAFTGTTELEYTAIGVDALPVRRAIPAAARCIAPYARPEGQGLSETARWRMIPLAEARDARGVRRGAPAWMLVHHDAPFPGAVIAAIGFQDRKLLWSETVGGLIADAARRCLWGQFLRRAGSDRFSYLPGESATVGAEAVNLDRIDREVSVRVTVTASGAAAPLLRETRGLAVPAGGTRDAQWPWRVTGAPGAEFQVEVDLLLHGIVIDRVAHDVGVLRDRPAQDHEIVTVAGGDFRLGGSQWYPVGVNYWPSYVPGLEPRDFHLGWLTPGYYIPAEIERDLARMEALGMNMLSIQLRDAVQAPNLRDFLRRAGRRGFKVNLFVGQASPLGFNERAVREIVERADLAGDPVLFAYDTIWEPGNWVFSAERRGRWDRDWEAWIVERYGSLDAAAADWRHPVPLRDGAVTSPSDAQLRTAGPWRVMVAAYRRFMDDLTSRKWNDATARLRRIDPRHLVSFRQGNTLPHDFALTGPVKHIDFICPEGYAIEPGEDGYHAAGFITRYVRFTTGGKPVIWSEFGLSAWDAREARVCEDALARQEAYHEMFYRMVLADGAHGTAPWWWPGGYRVDERSDFGIAQADGILRGAAQCIGRYAQRLKTPRAWPEPEEWITIDRDAHPGGYWYIAFNDGKEAHRRAAAAGRRLGVRTAGTGTTSATAPRLAIGSTPLTGTNPPRYLNAEFNRVEIRCGEGQWRPVPRGAEIPVAAGEAVALRVSAGNTQEAAWLPAVGAQDAPGAVCLAVLSGADVLQKQPLAGQTAHLEDTQFDTFELALPAALPLALSLRMYAEGIGGFGERWFFTLVRGGGGGGGGGGTSEVRRVTFKETDALLAVPGQGWMSQRRTPEAAPRFPYSVVYVRFNWADAEPEEGRYNWALIDDVIAAWNPRGATVAMRVMTCNAHSRGYYASPKWLFDAGCKGFEYVRGGDDPTSGGARIPRIEPDYSDPIYLDRHGAFIRALGARYDNHPDVEFLDIGSYGIWGEWHTPNPAPAAVRRRIVDLYLESFRATPLVFMSDDAEVLPYALSRGTGMRRDGVGSPWHEQNWIGSKKYAGVEGMAEVWKKAPVVFEWFGNYEYLQSRQWSFDAAVAFMLRNHVTLINDNVGRVPPEAMPSLEKLARLAGARYVLRELAHATTVARGEDLRLEMRWAHTGVGALYRPYVLQVALLDGEGREAYSAQGRCDPRAWLPGEYEVLETLAIPAGLNPGEYTLAIAVVDPAGRRRSLPLAMDAPRVGDRYAVSRVVCK